jgi:ankyrin repeat protein
MKLSKQKIVLAFAFTVSVAFCQACSTLMRPALIQATDQNQQSEVDRLLASGENPNQETKDGVTPLHIASERGYGKIAKSLIEKKADVNAAVKKTFKYKGEDVPKGSTPLMAAIDNYHFDIADMLIANGAKVNLLTENGSSALMIAADKKNPEMVKTLIKKGAKVNETTLYPFQYKGETIQSGSTALMAAAAGNRDENAKILIDNGADVNKRTKLGVDALLIAAANGNEDMVKMLIEKGAKPDATTTQDFTVKGQPVFKGSTTLMAAADGGHAGVVKQLIQAGADVNQANEKGVTALMAATAKGHLGAVKALVEAGADVNAKTTVQFKIGKEIVPKGSRPLSGAAYYGHAQVVVFLIENGADVNGKDDEAAVDPLFLAATKGHYETAKVLIENGADVYAVSKLGTAVNTAYHNGYPLIVNLINKAREQSKKNAAGSKH